MAHAPPDTLKRKGLRQVRDNLQPGDRVRPDASLFVTLLGGEIQRRFDQHKAKQCAGNK